VYHDHDGKDCVSAFHTLFAEERELIMTSLLAYFDESGKFADRAMVSYAGFAATLSNAQEFGREWTYWLRRFGIERGGLSMKKALNHRVKLSSRDDSPGIDSRISILMNFAACIHKYLEFGVYVAVDAIAFKMLNSEVQKILGKDPHYMSFSRALISVLDYFQNDNVAVVCDDEEKYSVECYKIYTKMRVQEKTLRDRLTAISFGEDRHHQMLQAADMLV